MNDPVSAIRNVGPATEAEFARAGILTAEEIRQLGADTAYERLIASGTRPHFIGYYALVMGLQGRPWSDCRGKEKDALRQKFDAIRQRVRQLPSEDGISGQLARDLDRIGVRL